MPAKPFDPTAPEALVRLQTRFAAHIRDPERHLPPPDIENRRMAIYNELFFNSISSMLAGTFPVIHELLSESQWRTLVRAFYRSGANKTPYFPEIPRDFVRWLNSDNPLSDKPFLPELAHYEWLELAVQIDKTPPPASQPLPADRAALLDGSPQPSPWVRLGSYRFPVHRIQRTYQPCKPNGKHHFFLIYRQHEDSQESVRFLNINAVAAMLFALIKDNPQVALSRLLAKLGQQIGHQQPTVLQDAAIGLIQDWYQRGILAGYRMTNP